jgi:hypothetical protein
VEVERVNLERMATMGLVRRVVGMEYNGRVDQELTMEGVVVGVTMLMVQEVKVEVVADHPLIPAPESAGAPTRFLVHQIQVVEVVVVEGLIQGVHRVARESS